MCYCPSVNSDDLERSLTSRDTQEFCWPFEEEIKLFPTLQSPYLLLCISHPHPHMGTCAYTPADTQTHVCILPTSPLQRGRDRRYWSQGKSVSRLGSILLSAAFKKKKKGFFACVRQHVVTLFPSQWSNPRILLWKLGFPLTTKEVPSAVCFHTRCWMVLSLSVAPL